MHQLVYVGQLVEPVYNVFEHDHAQWELVYVKSGTGVFHINNEVLIDFSPGDIFLLPPKTKHFETAPGGYTNYFIFFNECFLSENRLYYYYQDKTRSLYSVIRLLFTEFSGNIIQNRNIVDAIFETLGQYIRNLASLSEQAECVLMLRQTIESHYRNPEFDINDNLDDIPFNPEHFRRMFFRATGFTPLQYLIHLRIEHSKILIASRKRTGLSFQQIAYQSGFKDPYYFSRVFKKKNKLSPREWEKLSPYNKHEKMST